MSLNVQTLTAPEKISDVVSSSVPVAIGDAIKSDAKKADRSESYIIAKILTRHYKGRIAKKAPKPARQQRLAA